MKRKTVESLFGDHPGRKSDLKSDIYILGNVKGKIAEKVALKEVHVLGNTEGKISESDLKRATWKYKGKGFRKKWP